MSVQDMAPCFSVVGIFSFHLAYFLCMNSTGKSLGKESTEKKKKRNKREFLSIIVNAQEVLLLNINN